MNRVDVTLNDICLKTEAQLDRDFYLDGVREYQSHFMCLEGRAAARRDFDGFIKSYMASCWWVFCNRN